MAKRRRKNHTRRAWLATLLTVLVIGLLFAAARIVAARVAARRTAQEAADAGVMRYSADIPRNPYLHEGFSVRDGRVCYDDGTYRSAAGIDVSSHQGTIDWNAVAGDGISFAIVQAGYRGYSDGALNEDANFHVNLSGAKAVGLETGVYFFSQAVSVAEAEEEAAYVLELLGGEALDLPVFYDWEFVSADGARTAAVDGETVTACARAFCAAVEAGGYKAGVYFNQNLVYTMVELAELLEYPLWMAQYRTEPEFFYDFVWWQYSDSGTVAGIEGPVDLDLRFYIPEAAENVY